MIRTVVIPEEQNISIKVPENFVGRQVEVIAFTIEETLKESNIEDKPLTYFTSEKALAKDWLTNEEDKAWQDL
ncbi:MAG: DUF2281 domain-containing protein [Bacteroidota bacterium]|nr:DUF2281 domain-containing protein [Bacteroidota bacterium]